MDTENAKIPISSLPDPALLRLLCERVMGWREYKGWQVEPFNDSWFRVLDGASVQHYQDGTPSRIFDPLRNLNDAAEITARLAVLGWGTDISVIVLDEGHITIAATLFKNGAAHCTETVNVEDGKSISSLESRLRCQLAAWAVENGERRKDDAS